MDIIIELTIIEETELLKKFAKNQWLYISLFTILAFSLLTLANYQFASTNPGGNDFLVHWMGTRNFVTEGTSPYSDETALNIQTLIYGRAAQEGEHEMRVAYPLYSIFLFLPFALIKDYVLARALWMSVLEISLVLITILSLRLTFWKVRPLWLAGFLLFVILSYHGARPLINGNAIIVITLFVLLALMCIRNGKDEAAGILLALSTIKPQNVILLVAFVLLWAIFNKRTKIIAYFLGSMFLLVGFATVLIPDWFVQDFREILRYPSYNPPLSLGAAVAAKFGGVGQRLSYVITGVLTTLLLFEWWLGRFADTKRFLWLAFLTIAISQWIGISTDPGNFILLYPGMFFCFAMIDARWKGKSKLFIGILLGVLLVGLWMLFLVTAHHSYTLIQSSYMFLPMPFVCLLLLYWVRWWSVKSNRINSFESFDFL
ncbi:hypothetical protein SDC9_99517 [bioreactor metagenome]|uniref:DUF2029 domain-containing protein n=1 Tax=bioreactor metagenome TaxID=1076179 RepID=A0A645AHS8_9ZZZZ